MNTDGTEQRGGRRGEVTPITTLLSFGQLTRASETGCRFEIHREHEPLPDAPGADADHLRRLLRPASRDFEALGGFDEGYFLHVEDIDLCWRARQAGGQVLFQPAAQVVHLGHTSLEHPLKVEFHKGVGLSRYFIKRADTPPALRDRRPAGPGHHADERVRPLLWKITGRPI
jgi:N-acetylglucosaminyl-diphospho-decaprenol L-rhamnosyltransferase